MTKRALDLVASVSGLMLLLPVLVAVAIAIKLDTAGPVLFRQLRIGRYFRPFHIYKFRTMVADAPSKGGVITAHGDPRITRVGRFLRRTKIDELPQLLNVLKGEMSLVGPRPEVPQYVELFRDDFRKILQVRPGLTDLAGVAFPDEERVLARVADPVAEYRQRILPQKLALAAESIDRSSLFFDISVIFKTVLTIVAGRAYPSARPSSSGTTPSVPRA